jgi:hypothetical protein
LLSEWFLLEVLIGEISQKARHKDSHKLFAGGGLTGSLFLTDTVLRIQQIPMHDLIDIRRRFMMVVGFVFLEFSIAVCILFGDSFEDTSGSSFFVMILF